MGLIKVSKAPNMDGSGFQTGECYCPQRKKGEVEEIDGQKIHRLCAGWINE